MAYDEALAERMQDAVTGKRGVTTKKMFGGICFLLDGKMFAGIIKTDLMVRLHPQAEAEALTKPGVRPMDFTGRPMKGYLYVAGDALIDDEALVAWMGEAMAYVATLPEKAPKPPKKPKAKA